ncbi:hypothetical protein GCM10007301_15730 [Azorhizobium oxalatiphilum]|uniref:Uncharacterized protein n=1 Tax=Azorhizobium oxalatiphilum TaxID=980631 RepID=A0A917BSC0_9HYPH|nr:hypothetical protein [Azorhizobium oxalatiphilum]GGF56879.1 hypothetical protein GCM10007301_15730 [Azorhizobium oxalatiphilum]
MGEWWELPDGPEPPYLERRLSELGQSGDWVLELGCLCHEQILPIDNLARRICGDPTLGDVLGRLICPRCLQRPTFAVLVDMPGLWARSMSGGGLRSIHLLPKRGG